MAQRRMSRQRKIFETLANFDPHGGKNGDTYSVIGSVESCLQTSGGMRGNSDYEGGGWGREIKTAAITTRKKDSVETKKV